MNKYLSYYCRLILNKCNDVCFETTFNLKKLQKQPPKNLVSFLSSFLTLTLIPPLPPPPPGRQRGRDRAAAAARAAAEPVQHHPRPGPAVPRPGGVLPVRREPVAADPGRGAGDGGQLRALRAVPADLCGGEPAGPPAARRPVSGGWERGREGEGEREGEREGGGGERALLVRSEEELHSQIDCGDTVIQLTNLSKDTSDRARDIIQLLSTLLRVLLSRTNQ